AAIGVYMRIREREDTLEVLETILRLQLESNLKEDAAVSLEEISASLEGEPQLARRQQLTELYRSLGDSEAVMRTVEGSLELRPDDQALRAALRKEYEAAGAWRKTADLVIADAE